MLYSEVNCEVDGDEVVVSIQEQLPLVEDVIFYNVKFIRDEDCYAIAAEPVSFTKDFDTVQDGCIEGVVDLSIDILPKAVLEMAEKKALVVVEGMIEQEEKERMDGGW